ncbi:thioredoxin-related protein [Peptoniphilus olsenii]|uniref:Thioredoxin-related protein n=1 Tax=Peptoniphilus olsenii TaxID=411570 RepID=A0ABV2J9T9_9FIRM
MKIKYTSKKIKIVGIFSIIVFLIIFLNIKNNKTVNYEYTNIQLCDLEDNKRTIILNNKKILMIMKLN